MCGSTSTKAGPAWVDVHGAATAVLDGRCRRVFRSTDVRAHTVGVITDIFRHQYGCISRSQAGDAGLTERQIDLRVARREWVRCHPGVYRHAAAPESFDQRCMAAVLAAGEGAALSHRTAAVRIGTHAFRGDVIEVAVPGGRRPRLEGVLVHRVRDLDPVWVDRSSGIATTTAARTLADLAAVVATGIVERVMEEWIADRKVTVADAGACFDELRGTGRPWAATAAKLLAGRVLGDGVGDSSWEDLIPRALAAYGAPLPVHHHLIRVDGSVVAEPDHAYVDERLALELHGYDPHTRSRRAFEDTLAKSNRYADLGWELRVYTPAQVRARPWTVAREIDDHRERLARLVADGRR